MDSLNTNATRTPRMVLIDDDPSYTTILKRKAEVDGIQLDAFHSLSELGFVALLRNYDVAIIDYELEEMNGVEIAEYMSSLLDDMPMVLISASDRTEEMTHCPGSVRVFVNKADGFDKILNAARQCLIAEAS
jgi:DNA-binding response OmpR family regulator